MKAFPKLIAVSAAAAMLLSGCSSLYSTETTPTDTLTSFEELEAYLDASEDPIIASLEEYLAPVNIPEGMTLTKIEVQPERHFITYHYNLNRYVATAEEIAEDLVKDIDVSMFSFFPTTGVQDTVYDPEKAARTVLKETDDYQFRWRYDGDGDALLEKGLEYYGDPVELGEETYHISEITENLVVDNTPQGEGYNTLFYQIVWAQDDYLFFVKLPWEIAQTKEETQPYTEMAWNTIDPQPAAE